MRAFRLALATAVCGALASAGARAQVVRQPVSIPIGGGQPQVRRATEPNRQTLLNQEEVVSATQWDGAGAHSADGAGSDPYEGGHPTVGVCNCGAPSGRWFGADRAWQLCRCSRCDETKIGGWLQLGYHDKATPRSRVRGDRLAMNDVPGTVNVQQFWLYVEKEAARYGCQWDFGYRIDFLYGTDAQKTQAFGNPPDLFGNPRGWDNEWDDGVYGWAIPQLYLEAARGNLSILLGHFYTLVGYETITAPDNFFYSHSLTTFNSEPFTHTGVLLNYTAGRRLDLYAGWTLGWDTGFDQFRDGNNFLGGLRFWLSDALTVDYIYTAGDFGARGSDAYAHSLVFALKLSERLRLVLQQDVVAIGAGAPGGLFNDQVSITQYVIYRWNDCLAFGGRLEWWKSDGVSFYQLTAGLNFKPHPNVLVRPELRYDWQGNLDRGGVIGGDQATAGIDAILTY